MPVQVHREPHALAMYPGEPCCKCGHPTHFWFLKKDVALCGRCSEEVEEADIPSKREWLNAHGANLPENWQPYVEAIKPKKRGRPRKVQEFEVGDG